MELPKAVELLSDSAYRGMTTFHQDYKDAQKLGIEAIIAIQLWRLDWAGDRLHQLPGETLPQPLTQPTRLIDLGL